jgi:signal transduction histidine kinase
VSVSVGEERGRAVLRVHDDGSGFDPAASHASRGGLERIREAARELGGDFLIESRPGGPTCLRLRFALPAPGRRNMLARQEAGA